MDYKTLFNMIGGLGLFLFGMQLMGDGLQKVAGDRLKKLLEVLTNNRLMGVLVGTAVTAVIQSSSATTVMVVGFVNAGLMNLFQAAGVIMGANIGTTITAQLIAFKLTTIAPVVVGIGVAMYLMAKKKRIRQIGEILLGFGILFMGMEVMESALKPLANLPQFKTLIINMGEYPILGLLVGLGLTAIIQSSSASTGILLALAAAGAITIEAALPVLFGCNIGTCVTALLASIGASKTAKRAALIHLTFNVVGSLVFMLLLTPFKETIYLLGQLTGTEGDIQRYIANAHTVFNLVNTILLAPFIPLLVKFVTKILPGQSEAEVFSLKYVDDRILDTPSIAVGQTVKEVIRMGKISAENIKTSIEAFLTEDEALVKEVYNKEELINYLDREISGYMVKVSQKELSEEQSQTIKFMFHTINDLERIGDHAENIVELAQYRIDNKLKFSEKAIDELKNMYQKVYSTVKNAVDSLESGDVNNAMSVIATESEIDEIEKRLRAEHIDRLNQGICVPASGTIFLDVISNLERVADHATNIAQAVAGQI